jgi:2-polyprenyl-3-methyl-5-hydroxy-6-metoxy-1,4-benzoquinol methylase
MAGAKRSGDKITIEGDYQEKALHHGIIFQRSWHRLKLMAATQSLVNPLNAPIILDIGCGSGTLLQFINRGYKSYTGIDVNQAAITYCRERYPAPENQFRLMEFDDLKELGGQAFTHIFFLESIEHITPEQGLNVLKTARELLGKDGKMVITTPNRKSAWPLIESLLDIFKLTPTLAHEQHEHLYSPAELKDLALDAGFHVQKIFTMNGLAPWLSFLGNKFTHTIHQWECRNDWLPGSIIVMELLKKENP